MLAISLVIPPIGGFPVADNLGMEFPTVTDFKVGFDAGAKAANPDVQILNQVAGTFSDPAKGKEIALAQIGQGADVIFPIAGGTGIGSLQAVKDSGKLAVGIAKNEWYEKLVPADVRAEVDALEAKIVAGELEVKTDM